MTIEDLIWLDLPKKDENGRGYLSYSQINSFQNYRKDFINSTILGEPFQTNPYIDFGSRIGGALETGDFGDFEPWESDVLSKCVRLDDFERRVTLNFPGFYMVGYIDTSTADGLRIIDYKTGSRPDSYESEKYTQLCYYALALWQETGVKPEKAQVQLIKRGGNAFRGESLYLKKEDPVMIDIDISEERLRRVYWDTIDIAREIVKLKREYDEP